MLTFIEKEMFMKVLTVSDNGQTVKYLKEDESYENILKIDTHDLYALVNMLFEQTQDLPELKELNLEKIHNIAARVITEQIYAKLAEFRDEIEPFKEALRLTYDGPLDGVDHYLEQLHNSR